MDRYLTEVEQGRLLDVLKRQAALPLDRRDAAAIRALLHSGARIGEFLKVSLGDALAALQSGYLFIPKEHRKGWNRRERVRKDGTTFVPLPPKDHQVFVTEALRADLRELLKVRFELAPDDAPATAPLVVGRSGRGLTVRAFQFRFAEWADRAGLPPKASPHWLRHTRAMNVMRRSTASDPRGVVQSALGHASIRSTGVYTATPREAVEAALTETDVRVGRVTRAVLRRAFEGRAA